MTVCWLAGYSVDDRSSWRCVWQCYSLRNI